MKLIKFMLPMLSLLFFGCGGGSSSDIYVGDTPDDGGLVAYYKDGDVANVTYECGKYKGVTDENGAFRFEKNKGCVLSVADIVLRNIKPTELREGVVVFESDVKVASFLQSLDLNNMYSNTIHIDNETIQKLRELKQTTIPEDDGAMQTLVAQLNSKLNNQSLVFVSQAKAQEHLKLSYKTLEGEDVVVTDGNASWIDKKIVGMSDNEFFSKTEYALLAWSDTGMHCSDGSYSVFSLLPLGNTLKAQLVVKGASPRIVNADVVLTYEAVEKKDGSINTTSSDKTDFWDYATKLFPSLTSLASDTGLAKKPTQSTTPISMDYNISQNLYVAKAIPTFPKNDNGETDHYPMVKVVAKNKNGDVLATTVATLPVSDEMDCLKCHSSRMGILKKHDKNLPNVIKDNAAELKAKGYNYNENGLEATAKEGTPILCSACHKDNAIHQSGIDGIKSLSEAIHMYHADVSNPETGETLGLSETRDTCYSCHPGESTQCLRGAMGSVKDENGENKIDCQSCHGSMYAVAQHSREGWSNEPNCQSCHQEGKRYEKAVTNLSKGTLREILDTRFATQTTVHDTNGSKLYSLSTGHNGMACSACHGTQHAIYPSSLPQENNQSITLQGYAGTLRECGVCHKNDLSPTMHNGPHGLHTLGQEWVDMHGTKVLTHGTAECKICHGADLKGTHLSEVKTKRVLKLGVLDVYKTYNPNEKVGCADCHNSNTVEVSNENR